MSHDQSALLIAGPTATGKSALAVAAARRLGGEVVNADSMQIYRDLRILSARPGPDEMAGIPHHLFGGLAAEDACSVGRWHDLAAAAVSEIWSRGALPILVGGTGLYFRAALEGLAEVPDIPDDIRSAIRALPTAELRSALQREDPDMAQRLEPGDTQRMARALEVKRATGKSLAAWQAQQTPGFLTGKPTARFVLTMDRARLYARIDRRFDAMMAAGALDEVRALLNRRLAPDHPIMKALGIPQLARHLNGECTLEAAVERARTETRQYAKRQLTWFRNQFGDWTWLDAEDTTVADQLIEALKT